MTSNNVTPKKFESGGDAWDDWDEEADDDLSPASTGSSGVSPVEVVIIGFFQGLKSQENSFKWEEAVLLIDRRLNNFA